MVFPLGYSTSWLCYSFFNVDLYAIFQSFVLESQVSFLMYIYIKFIVSCMFYFSTAGLFHVEEVHCHPR